MGYGNQGPKFEPKPGCGTLFIEHKKKKPTSPDYDGYIIMDRDVKAGEKIKLAGWDKEPAGNMINLKIGKDQQELPQGRFAPQQQAQGRRDAYQGHAPTAPNQPHQGYQNPNPTYGRPPQGQAPAGRFQGQQPSYQAPSGQPPQGQYVPPGPNGSGAPPPMDEGELPF
jgi:hypothetical protein